MWNEKILMTYAGRDGATEEVAHEVGRVLSERGAVVDVCRLREADDLRPYTAFVVGGSVRRGRWLPEALRFIERNRDTLGRAPVALFAVRRGARENKPEDDQTALSVLEPARARVQPVRVACFTVAQNRMPVPFPWWPALRSGAGAGAGNYDWNAIHSWARGLQTVLARVSRS